MRIWTYRDGVEETTGIGEVVVEVVKSGLGKEPIRLGWLSCERLQGVQSNDKSTRRS